MKHLSEALRPSELGDLIQPLAVIRKLEKIATSGKSCNLLFYGEPGLGKTSAARLILSQMGDNWFEINGSLKTGVDDVRFIETAAKSAGLGQGPRMCFIDEAEYLSKNAQAGLRGLIEATRCGFLLTANDASRFHSALMSRCMPICFDVESGEAGDVIKRLVPRYRKKLTGLGIDLSVARITELMAIYFPDLRALAHRIEFDSL